VPDVRRALALAVIAGVMAASVACGGSDRSGSGTFDAPAGAQGGTPTTAAKGGPVPACDTDESECSTGVDGLTLRVTGPAADVGPVGPPADHPLATVDRDAGISVRLRDGSVLWLFGDTAARDELGQLTYFVIGSGAWAPQDRPLTTEDHVGPDGLPVPLAVPTPEFPRCPDPRQRPGMWPTAAIVEPVGARDRVVIWFGNVCLGVEGETPLLTDVGMSVGEWWYDPADPPAGRPITATILDQVLFPIRSYGLAAVEDDTGRVVTFRCDQDPERAAEPDAFGPCGAAITDLAGIADADTYRVWRNGSPGPPGSAAAVGTELPESDELVMPSGSSWAYPAGGFSVVHDPTVGAYVAAYSPWPAQSDVIQIRVATSPTGPWSRPISVRLPGCDDRIGDRLFLCYAATAQPIFSEPGSIGIGYYDAMVSRFPTRGTYRVARVPVEVERTAT
jgi:hypothetical protein